jgi:hypothetical protein
MRMSAIASAIEKDLFADRPQRDHRSALCLACGRSYINGDGRFCSTRCRDGFDVGLPPFQQQETRSAQTWFAGRSMRPRGDGFLIPCAHCKREFVSKGLRCCSTECERKLRARKDIAETLTGHAVEGSGYVKSKCEKCGGNIPRRGLKRGNERPPKAPAFAVESAGRLRSVSHKVFGVEWPRKYPPNGDLDLRANGSPACSHYRYRFMKPGSRDARGPHANQPSRAIGTRWSTWVLRLGEPSGA